MEETEFQTRLRERLGLRVGPEMAKYLLTKVSKPAAGSISAMGGDARTGIPMHKTIPISILKTLADDQPTPQA